MRVRDGGHWWQRLLGHRLDAYPAVGEWATESISRTGLARPPFRIPITILATRAARHKLRELRIGGDKSISLLAVVAAIQADSDRLPIVNEHPPDTASVLPAAQLRDEIRARLHGTCIRGHDSLTISARAS